MIRKTELWLIRNLELFRFRQMLDDWKKAEEAYSLLEKILKKHNEIDEET